MLKGHPYVYKGAHKTVILKIMIMASVRQDWERNNGNPQLDRVD